MKRKKILSLGKILGIASIVPLIGIASAVPLIVSYANPTTNELKEAEIKIKQLKQEIANLKNKLNDLNNRLVTISTDLINLASDSKNDFLELVKLYNKFKRAEPILNIDNEKILIEEIPEDQLIWNFENSKKIKAVLERYTDSLINAIKDFKNKYDELKAEYDKLANYNNELIGIINNAGDQIDRIIATSDDLYEQYNTIKDNKETEEETNLRLILKDALEPLFSKNYQINVSTTVNFKDAINLIKEQQNSDDEKELKEKILSVKPDLEERTKQIINKEIFEKLGIKLVQMPKILYSLAFDQEFNKLIKINLTVLSDNDKAVNTMYSFIINEFGE